MIRFSAEVHRITRLIKMQEKNSSNGQNAGFGDIDFACSENERVRVQKILVEIKLTSNPQLMHGLKNSYRFIWRKKIQKKQYI